MAPQIPNYSQSAVDKDGLFTSTWFAYFENVYRAIRSNLPTKLSGILDIETTPVGNVGGGTNDLITYSLPANMMQNNGDYLEIEAWGTYAANANNKTVTLNFGSQVILTTGAIAANSGSWKINASIVRLSPTTQEINAQIIAGNASVTTSSTRTAGTQDLTAAVTIKCTGAATSDNDIIQKIMITKLSPND